MSQSGVPAESPPRALGPVPVGMVLLSARRRKKLRATHAPACAEGVTSAYGPSLPPGAKLPPGGGSLGTAEVIIDEIDDEPGPGEDAPMVPLG